MQGLEQAHAACHENGQDCGQLCVRVLADKDIDSTSTVYRDWAALPCAKALDTIHFNDSFASLSLTDPIHGDTQPIPLSSTYVHAIVSVE